MNKSAFKLLSFNYFLSKYFKKYSDIIILNNESTQFIDLNDGRVSYLEKNINSDTKKDWLDNSYYQSIHYKLNSELLQENPLLEFVYLN